MAQLRTSIPEEAGSIPRFTQWAKYPGHRGSLDLVLLWLWRMPAATALIRPLAWELPHAMSAALKCKKKIKEPNGIDL